MPYTAKDAPVRRQLSGHALEIWVSAFNAAVERYKEESRAFRVAWSAVVKAGYRKGKDGKWHKSAASKFADALAALQGQDVADVAIEQALAEEDALESAPVLEDGEIRLLTEVEFEDTEESEAQSLPRRGTPSKVLAEFKLISFGKPNKNKDGFRPEDITDEVVASLIGSPIYLQEDASDHPLRDAKATERAKFQAGVVTQAEKREDGLYCVGTFQREVLADRDIRPAELPKAYSVSMEVTFDRSKAQYTVGDRTLPYREAKAEGVASPMGTPDDRGKYDVRWIPPTEFHAVALLQRGRNADTEADVLKVAAQDEGDPNMYDEITWSAEDIEAYEAYFALNPGEEKAMGAVLTTEKRKALPRGQFAYVDEKGEGHLPIHDAAHVRNALARLNQTDIPEAAKRKALRKILAAAKRMGVEVSKDSPAVKAYSDMHGSMEDMMSHIREAFYKQFGNSDPAYVVETYADHVIARKGDEVLKVPYTMDGEEVKFGDAVKGKMVFEQEKAKADTPAPAATVDAEAVRKAAVAETEARLRKESEAREKAAAERAVEAYKAREKAAADRLKELDEIVPVEDDEREDLEKRVHEADDKGYAELKEERLRAKIKALEAKDKAAASGGPAPTLRPGQKPGDKQPRNPYNVTVQ